MTYYLWLNEEQKGPFTLNQLRAMWNSGIITVETLYITNEGTEWLALANMLSALEKFPQISKIQNPSSPNLELTSRQSKGRSSITLFIWSALFIVITVSALIFLNRKSEINKESQQVPEQIQIALNNLKGAIDTGVSLNDYTKMIIAVRSAIATYGSRLSSSQLNLLQEMLENCDVSIRILNKTKLIDDYPGVWIELYSNSDEDNKLIDWLSRHHIEESDIPDRSSPTWHIYAKDRVLKSMTNTIEIDIDTILLPNILNN